MPGAEILIARYRESAAGLVAGRTPDRAPSVDPAAVDLTSGLREACSNIAADLRVYCDERIGRDDRIAHTN